MEAPLGQVRREWSRPSTAGACAPELPAASAGLNNTARRLAYRLHNRAQVGIAVPGGRGALWSIRGGVLEAQRDGPARRHAAKQRLQIPARGGHSKAVTDIVL
jgi:hypothetical protein